MNAEINKKEEKYIVEIINAAEGGLGGREINNALKLRMRRKAPSERTVRRILDALIKKGAISRTGKNRYAKYQRVEAPVSGAKDDDKPVIPVSDEGKSIQEYVRRPVCAQARMQFRRQFMHATRAKLRNISADRGNIPRGYIIPGQGYLCPDDPLPIT